MTCFFETKNILIIFGAKNGYFILGFKNSWHTTMYFANVYFVLGLICSKVHTSLSTILAILVVLDNPWSAVPSHCSVQGMCVFVNHFLS